MLKREFEIIEEHGYAEAIAKAIDHDNENLFLYIETNAIYDSQRIKPYRADVGFPYVWPPIEYQDVDTGESRVSIYVVAHSTMEKEFKEFSSWLVKHYNAVEIIH